MPATPPFVYRLASCWPVVVAGLFLCQRAHSLRSPLSRLGYAMKQDIHPDYHFINVVLPSGASYRTRSTYAKEGATLNLDIDPSTHPAWTGGQQHMLDRGGRVSRFNAKFAGFTAKR